MGNPSPDEPGLPWLRPEPPSTRSRPDLPESPLYRVKRRVLGPPLVSDALEGESLGKPVALAVLSSDVMSSAAYASESILRILIPAAGLGAFALITPVTVLLLVVLGVVCLCYRDVVDHYPVSGGSYVVTRENFGPTAAQIPGAALLCSYTLTVAVSIAAGVDAVISAFPAIGHPVLLSVLAVLLLSLGNLRGVKEAGRFFAIPTYWFLASMAALLIAGLTRVATNGGLAHIPPGPHPIHVAPTGSGLLLGASVFIFLRGFANGGSAMTGMEAISNAVTIFREPQRRNAKATLLLMALILGVLFLSVSAFAALTHDIPSITGTPTVLSDLGKHLFGSSGAGRVLYYSLQFSTALILILGANTSFNGFPLLVSAIASDAYLPRAFTTRGHRLVHSNGIVVLSGLSILLLVVTSANVAALIPLYACTVFTGFTMAGAGMTRYHLTHPDEPRHGRRLAANAFAFVASAAVTLIFVVTEFSRGAWAVVVVVPLIVLALSRTNRRYRQERVALAEEGVPSALATSRLPHQVVVVLVDRVDLATTRALRLARNLALDHELRAVHFMIDEARARRLSQTWTRVGLGPIPLEVIEVPDRRLSRAATELADELAADGRTEVLLVLPRRASRGVVGRLLHDRTADRIVAAVSQIPNVSATVAPVDVQRAIRSGEAAGTHHAAGHATTRDAAPAEGQRAVGQNGQAAAAVTAEPSRDAAERESILTVPGATPIGEVQHRRRATVAGRIKVVRVQSWSGVPAFECTIVDGTGALTIVFLGRREVAALHPGTRLIAEGTIGSYRGRLAMLNPTYDLTVPGSGAHRQLG